MTQPHAVTVYSKPACQQCTATHRKFRAVGVEFTHVDITEDADAYEFVIALGHKRAPVVYVDDGTHWSGFQPDKIERLKENA